MSHSELASLQKKYWWKNAIIYEVYVDRFAGDLKGFIKKIPYLSKLGITCVHILPHFPTPMVDDGYDISDYLNVREDLGTLEDFKAFANAAHEAGIKIIVDLVLNHTSTEHAWFKEASSSLENPKRNYYLWSKTGAELKESLNSFAGLKDSNWIYNKATDDYYFSTFYPEQADLNWDNPIIFEEATKIMTFWVEHGADGFRLDAATHFIKREGASYGLAETHVLLKQIRSFLDESHPGTIILAEAHEELSKMKEYFGNGDECHLMYHFLLCEQFFIALSGGGRKGLETIIAESWDIPENCDWVVYLRNHDELSLRTLSLADQQKIWAYFDPESNYRFSTGISMRLASMFNGDKQKILDAFRLLVSTPGTINLYYGEEIGMENEVQNPIPRDTRKLVRAPMEWDTVEKQDFDPLSILNGVRQFFTERHNPASLTGEE